MTATEAAPRTRTRRPASRRGVLIYAVGVLVLSAARRAWSWQRRPTRRRVPVRSCSS